MLRVTVELVPGGIEDYASTLETVYIGNDGTGNRDIGHYDIYTADPRGQDKSSGRHTRKGWIGRIQSFPRRDGYVRLAIWSLRLLAQLREEA